MRITVKKQFNEVIELLENLYSDFQLKETGKITRTCFVLVFKGQMKNIDKTIKFSFFLVDHNDYVEVSCAAKESKLKVRFLKDLKLNDIVNEDFVERLNLNKIEFEILEDE